MLPHAVKAAYFTIAGPVMRANGLLYKSFRAPRHGPVRVHLGPGRQNYLPGWINVDANAFTAKCDVWADLRHPLPFHDSTIDAFYSHHVVEHLPDIPFHLAEAMRCLRPGGVYRIAGPNGDSAIRKFMAQDNSWFGDFPDKRRSTGGRLANFIFCRNEHLTLLTQSFLHELLEDAGFITPELQLPGQTKRNAVFDEGLLAQERLAESDFATPHTLVIEAVKPDTRAAQ